MDDDRSTRAASQLKQISNEDRIAILHELASSETPLRFSELLEVLDDQDSGRLNYHLDKLRGTYVTQVDGRYRLTIQGSKIISSILASRYASENVEFSAPAGGTCIDCGGDLQLEQVDQQAIVRCVECDHKQFRKSVPPALWKNREPEDVPEALDRIVWSELKLATNRICGYCHSTMEPRVVPNDWDLDSELYGFYDFDVLAVFDCTLCTNWKLTPFGLLAWLHPKVQSFHQEIGVPPSSRKCWQIEQGIDPTFTTVVSEEPYRIAVSFPWENSECEVLFDERNEIISVSQEWSK